jgi:hypothetical protein
MKTWEEIKKEFFFTTCPLCGEMARWNPVKGVYECLSGCGEVILSEPH